MYVYVCKERSLSRCRPWTEKSTCPFMTTPAPSTTPDEAAASYAKHGLFWMKDILSPGEVEVLCRAELGDRSFENVGLTSIIDLTALAGELVKEIARETELGPVEVRKAFRTLGSPFHDQERPS